MIHMQTGIHFLWVQWNRNVLTYIECSLVNYRLISDLHRFPLRNVVQLVTTNVISAGLLDTVDTVTVWQ